MLPAFGFSASACKALSSTSRLTASHHPQCSRRPQQPVAMGSRRGGRPARRGDGRRPNRVSELIRRELAPIVDDVFAQMPTSATAPTIVSVVDVRCSDDLRNARVSVSVLGSDDEKKLALSWLRENRRAMRFELAQCVRGMKSVPELSFVESEVAQAVRTVGILDMLAKKRAEKEADGMAVAPVEAAVEDLDMDAMADDPFVDVEGSEERSESSFNKDGIDYVDEDDDFADELIIEVDADDDEAEDAYDGMDDESVRQLLFKTPGGLS